MAYDLGTAHGTIELEYKGHGAADEASKDIEKAGKDGKDTDGTLKKLGITWGGLGAIAKKAALGGALLEASVGASALAIHILGIVPNLASIASLSSALPAAFTGMISSVLVLKAAFSGVGDAVKAAFDPSKAADFQKALDKLSPSAAAFVTAIHKAAPELTNFQKGLQESFFSASHLATAIPLVQGALSTLSPELKGLAGDFGEYTRQVANFALSADSIRFVSNAIGAFRAGLSEAESGLLPLLAGLRAVGTVGTPLLTQLGTEVGKVATAFGAWLSKIASSGQLQTWINLAIATLKTLGGIVQNVGEILLSVIKAANASGGGFLNTLELITGQFATFLSSAGGASALTSIFSAILSVAKPLAPIITTAATALAQGLGPAIITITSKLGPALLDVVQKLAPAIAPLGTAIANLAVAIIPLLAPAAQLITVLAQLVSIVATDLAGQLAPLISALAGGLLTAFQNLGPVIQTFAAALPGAANAGQQLLAALAPLFPVLKQVGAALLTGLVQSLPTLTTTAQQLTTSLIPLVAILAQGLANALKILTPYIPILVQSFVEFQLQALQVVIIGAKLLVFFNTLGTNIANAVKSVFAAIGSFIGILRTGFTTAVAVVSAGITAVVGFFTGLPGRALAALKALPGLIVGAIKAALTATVVAAAFEIGILVGLFTKFPGDAYRAIKSLITSIPGVMRDAWNAAKTATTSAINSIVATAKGLPGRVKSAVNSVISGLKSVLVSAWNNAKSATTTGISNVVSYVKGLPGKMKSALGNVGTLLYNSGVQIINGLIRGIESGIGRVEGLLSSLASKAKAAFNSAINIFSPSRDFEESGEFIDEGLINGIKNKMSQVTAIASKLAQATINPTLDIPNVASAAVTASTGFLPAFLTQKHALMDQPGAGTFGPYQLEVDQGVLTSFTVDAVTGNPVAVSRAAREGSRVSSWTGSGRGSGS